MLSSDSLENIRKQRKEIAERTAGQFPDLVKLYEDGIWLLLTASEILDGIETTFDFQTAEGASKTAALRFLSSLPTNAEWCFAAAECGDYITAYHIQRLVLEEAVKLSYYSTFPEKALRQLVSGHGKDAVSLGTMLVELDSGNAGSKAKPKVMKLHGELSELYSHPNLNFPQELINMEDLERGVIRGEPRFLPDEFVDIVSRLLFLIAIATQDLLRRFPDSLTNENWLKRSEPYLTTVRQRIRPEKEGSQRGA